jgi:hypothetical protein
MMCGYNTDRGGQRDEVRYYGDTLFSLDESKIMDG